MKLDISKVPIEYTNFVWLHALIDANKQLELLIVSKPQQKHIFGNFLFAWKEYRGIKIKSK